MNLTKALRLLSVIACVLDCASATERNPKPAESLSTSQSLAATSSLCKLSAKICEHSETTTTFRHVEELLRSGANPNSRCPGSAESVLSLLVSQARHDMLRTIMSLDDLPNPLDLNSEFQFQGQTFTALGLATSRLLSDLHGQWEHFSTISYLLRNKKVDVSVRLPGGNYPVSSIYYRCSNQNIKRRLLHLFWLRPDLDDYQREFLLQVSPVREHWSIDFPFAAEDLSIFRSTPLSDLKLPLVAKEEDGSDISPVFLKYSSAAAFLFEVHENCSPAMAGHIRISVSKNDPKQGTVEQLVFSPSPSSLAALNEHDDNDDLDRVRWFGSMIRLIRRHPRKNPLLERMWIAGRIIGVCLNTLSASRAISLGVPLDRVVLQRLLDPNSPIERSEALNSAICVSALQTFREGFSLEQAFQKFPSRFPRIPFEHNGTNLSSHDGEAEWKDYCCELVKHMLHPEKSPAFEAMLQGFDDTIPEDQSRHYFSPVLAHRLLVDDRIPIDLLKSRISFEGKGGNSTLFLSVLDELAEEDPQNLNRFVQRLLRSPFNSDFTSIKVRWNPGWGWDPYRICVNPFCYTLVIPAIEDPSLMRGVLQNWCRLNDRAYELNEV